MSNTVTVNEALVTLQGIIDAANYILEDLETRKNQTIDIDNIVEQLQQKLNNDEFQKQLVDGLMSRFGEGAVKEVAFKIMDQIDSGIEQFVNSRVDARMAANGYSART